VPEDVEPSAESTQPETPSAVPSAPGNGVARNGTAILAPPAARRVSPVYPAGGRAGSHDQRGATVSVVVPTWNEAGNIRQVMNQLARFDDVVLVDGYSEDDTVRIARAVRPDVHVIERRPRGKGDALRAGFAAATGDVIVMMDADGSMDPEEVDAFVSMIAVGFDLVKGSRLACGGGSHDLTIVRWAGNKALCGLANHLFHTNWTDLCYGYIAFRRECLPRLALTADGFEVESQILANAALAGLRVAEIPSVELPRISGESHLNARRDGLRVVRAMLRARYSPRARRSAMALRPNTNG
jgi:glycosyltransferase involved in cell wall biosynthesis